MGHSDREMGGDDLFWPGDGWEIGHFDRKMVGDEVLVSRG